MLSPVEEGVPKRVEFAERLVGVNNESVAGNDAFHVAVHDGGKAVSGGFGTHPASRNVLLQ